MLKINVLVATTKLLDKEISVMNSNFLAFYFNFTLILFYF